ncbi:Cytochrome b5 [Spathaspora sp. JA1]|nr:Cytochrome b5 [Spathaspora sp. JA1]
MSPSLQTRSYQGTTTPNRHRKHQSLRYFTPEQVRQHDTPDDLWMIIYNKVYDITDICKDHPGGVEVLYDCGGVDATEAFEDVGHSDYASSLLDSAYLGEIIPTQQTQYSRSQSPIIAVSSKPEIKTDDIWNVAVSGKNHREWLRFGCLSLLALLSLFSYIYLQKQKWGDLGI